MELSIRHSTELGGLIPPVALALWRGQMANGFWLVRYETVGTPVYETETGPDIGYDDVQTGLMVVPDDFDEPDFKTYRKFDVIAELSAAEAMALCRALNRAVFA